MPSREHPSMLTYFSAFKTFCGAIFHLIVVANMQASKNGARFPGNFGIWREV